MAVCARKSGRGAAPGSRESGSVAAQGFVGRALGDPGLKPTVRVGEAAMREVAAYLLDHERFARVPTTALVKARFAAEQAAGQLLAAAPVGAWRARLACAP